MRRCACRRLATPAAGAALAVLSLFACTRELPAPEEHRPERTSEAAPAPELITITTDGAWCWFQGERAIVDPGAPDGPTLLVASTSSRGDNELAHLNLKTGALGHVTVHRGFGPDDHNVGALLQLGDGRYLMTYAAHRREPHFYSRISVAPHDPTGWSDESTTEVADARVTYSNLHALRGAEGGERVFNFTRARERDPNVLELSDPETLAWDWRGSLVRSPARRPYVRYASDGQAVHFLVSDGHPQTEHNAIHHGVFDGTVAAEPPHPSSLIPVYSGAPGVVPWVVDLEFDTRGHPHGLISTRRGTELSYHLARFDGERWQVDYLAHAGTALYEQQPDYSGLAALDPRDPNVVVVSTNAHPLTGKPLISQADGQRHWEVFHGRTTNRGLSWAWTPLTSNSTEDNLRPVIPDWDSDRRVILWMRGTYRTYRDWDTQIVGMIEDRARTD